jgi:choline-sulfatase
MRVLQWSLSLVLLAESALAAPAARPNVILITVDTARADRMGFLGSKRGLTPNLDALAGQGVVFNRAYSQVPLTAPSHVTILTGTYPQFHHVNDFGMPLAKNLPYLPQVLHDHGYKTAAFVGSVVLDPKSGSAPGFDRGFDTYDADFRVRQPGDDRYQTIERRGGDVVAHALAWLKDHPRGPFFLWIHLFDPHAPYDPPEPFKSRYASDLYDGEIAYADSALGTLLGQVRTRGLFDSALIAVMADHGEAFGEHGERNHGIFLYDETIHVPLLLKMPAKRSGGTRVDVRVGLVDVMPTILQTLGIPAPHAVQGESLLPWMKIKLKIKATTTKPADARRPSATMASADRAAYAETDYPHRDFGWSSLRALRADKYLFIEAPRQELYEQSADPKAEHNLSSAAPAVTDTLTGRLDAFRRKTASVANPAKVEVNPQLQQQLAALGYVSSGNVERPGMEQTGADPKDKIEIANLVQEALLAREDGRQQEAIQLLQQALAKDPANAVVNRNLGSALMDQQDYPRALPILRKATELNPDSSVDHYNLGLALFYTGDLEAAKTQLEIAIARAPAENLQSLANLHFTLAAVYNRLGRAGDATKQLQGAIQLQPDDYDANLTLGRLLTTQDATAALRYLQKAAQIQPNSPDPHAFLADAYTQLGQQGNALRERLEAQRLQGLAKP